MDIYDCLVTDDVYNTKGQIAAQVIIRRNVHKLYSYSIHNLLDNVTADVVLRSDGQYSVTLTDNDSGNTLPVVRICSDSLAAVTHARTLAGIYPSANPMVCA
jgi:hypothetical protein